MVEKLSSVRIITAASFDTSVPVMPIATPMSARFSAGASLTPSPVMATMSPRFLSRSTSRTLCSGATRAMTPRPPTCSIASGSLMAANSAPVIVRPVIPSRAAIDCAVTAWSPVIILTWMPAAFAWAIERAASGRGGSRIPTRARSVKPLIIPRRSPPGSKVSGSKSRRAVAMTRRPSFASASLAATYAARIPSTGTRDPSASYADAARSSSWSGAPLTKQRTTSRPLSSVALWKLAISL